MNTTKKKKSFSLPVVLITSAYFSVVSTASAALVLDQNRVVFPAAESQVAIVKVDNPTDTDFLMQSWVEDKNGKAQEDIFVDPPLSKIKANHKVALRLTTINSRLANQNEEQLYWLNVKEIPKLEAASGSPRLAIVMRTRVKILYRPTAVNADMDKEYTRLEWKHVGNGIVLHNPTPYYITFNKAWAGDKETNSFDLDMIAPGADLTIKSSVAAAAQQVNFTIIDDFGGTTDMVISKVK